MHLRFVRQRCLWRLSAEGIAWPSVTNAVEEIARRGSASYGGTEGEFLPGCGGWAITRIPQPPFRQLWLSDHGRLGLSFGSRSASAHSYIKLRVRAPERSVRALFRHSINSSLARHTWPGNLVLHLYAGSSVSPMDRWS